MSPDMKAKAVAQAVKTDSADEIDEIMNEIENLQKGIGAATKATQQEKPNLRAVPEVGTEEVHGEDMNEFKGGADDASLEDTLAGMKDESTGETILDKVVEATDEAEEETLEEESEEIHEDSAEDSMAETVHEIVEETVEEAAVESTHVANESSNGCLSMTLMGNMTLKLKYEYEGQEVTIGFADKVLKVQLSDGTEFKIPIGARSPFSKAA